MGVPVITCPGSTFVSRIGLSLLSSLGMEELVANSPDHYIDLAVNLANDLPLVSPRCAAPCDLAWNPRR